MGKIYQRIIATLLVALMMTALAACGGQPEDTDDPIVETDKWDPYSPYNETIVMTKGVTVAAQGSFKEGENFENNVFTRYLKNTMNIETKVLWEVDAALYDQKIALSIAIQEIPDIMVVDRIIYKQLLDNDLIWDMTEAYEKCISPFLKEQYDSYGERLFKEVEVDGKLMGIPGTSLGNCHNVLWIRKDWLDKLGMDAPTTLDEVIDTARAFKKLNYNGQNNTVGLTTTSDIYGGYNSWWGLDTIFSYYGAYPGVWLERDGKAVYGSILPEVKTALAKLRDLYAEGILDREFAIRNEADRQQLLGSGRLGMYFSVWWPSNGVPDSTINDKNAEWIAVSAPADANGKLKVPQNDPVQHIMVVSKKFKHPEAAIKALNAGYDVLRCNTSETNPYAEQAAEAYRYFMDTTPNAWKAMPIPIEINYEDCVRITMEDIENAIKAEDPSVMRIKGFEASYEMVLLNRQKPKESYAAYLEEMARIVGARAASAGNVELIPTCFYGNTRTMSTMWSSLKKMENEAMLKIITGEADIDSFDDFVSKWLRAGGQRITDEVEAERIK